MNEEAARSWVMRAEHDFTIALRDMEYTTPTTDMVCFHMQQAAEKYLKAFLVFHGREYPHTHRLEVVIQFCGEVDPEFYQLHDLGVDDLSRYATTMRYGETAYMPSLEETRRAMELAERVKAFVLHKLRQQGFQP